MKKILSLALFAFMIACQESQPAAEMQAPSNKTDAGAQTKAAAVENDSSEAVVGPDEAFFASVYLQDVFELSKANPMPASNASLKGAAVESAFDFAANFQPKRLALMCKLLLKSGDADQDGQLSLEEWSEMKLQTGDLGAGGEAISHEFSTEVFELIAGSDNQLSSGECESLLVRLGPVMQQVVEKQSKQEVRLRLIKAWEKVLNAYDADKDGQLSLEEQRTLRKERQKLMNELIES